MAKAILEFDLTDSDDKMEFERVNKSLDMALAIWEFAYNTKKKICYAIEEEETKGTSVSPYEAVEKVYEKLWEVLNERGVDPDKLIV